MCACFFLSIFEYFEEEKKQFDFLHRVENQLKHRDCLAPKTLPALRGRRAKLPLNEE